ncbi:response regulator [Ideonella sp.]|uniref:response regulator n=1 Tax=Ideonella sp. TaxID=1929293 RepID=UPI0035B18AA7
MPPTASLAAPAAATASATRRVLVVDDSRAMQAILRRALQHPSLGGTVIETAASGDEALAAVERAEPALLVSDWHMPGMTGIELLQTLRQLGHQLPVGFVTTETTPALLEQASTNGAAFILHKPFDDEVLRGAVAAALGLGQDGTATAPAAPDREAAARSMRLAVQAWMSGVPFRLVPGDRFGSARLSGQNLLALYTPASGGAVSALAVADLPALCMLGAGALSADPRDVRRAIQEGQAPVAFVESASAFFAGLADRVPAQLGTGPVAFKAANLAGRTMARLPQTLDQATVRADYRLSVPGYGDGHVALLQP